MKKASIIAVIFMALSLTSIAQKGNNKVGFGGELAIPAGGDFGQAFNTGFGGWIKFLFAVGKSGYVSFSSGYTSFTAKGSGSQESASISVLPILLGYRHALVKGLYVEPQAGYGSYRAKYTLNGQSASGSQGAFTYAIGIGYEVSDIDFGLRFQNGSIESVNYGNVAFRIGYNFSVKK
ncbi:MAG: outer membrane beta-barrel protein [Chitinophagaceae bacterium]|nr:outer membrane beta-barrel protein [Chitinophagaceae bacterium]